MALFIKNFSSIGHLPEDSENQKIQKSFLVFLATFMSCGGILWGSIALSYDLINQSMIPYGYAVLSGINMLYFKYSRNFKAVRFFQVFISLLLPFLFQASLGGFASSGLVMLWAVLALVASLSFDNFSTSFMWLFLFIVGTIASYMYEDFFITLKPEILPDFSLLFLTLNAAVISSIVFGLVMFFVMLNKEARVEISESNLKVKKLNSVLHKKYKEIEDAQTKLKLAYGEVEKTKERLTQITRKQTEINEMLLREKGMLGSSKN